MPRQRKTSQIQLRATPAQKAELVRRARAAGMDLSGWMLHRLLPDHAARFRALTRELAKSKDPAYALAQLNDLLAGLQQSELEAAVEVAPDVRLSELLANQLAAMVETAAARRRVRPPAWVDAVPPLRVPWFATNLVNLRLYLLCHSPPAFRRRNLFVDSTIGDRV